MDVAGLVEGCGYMNGYHHVGLCGGFGAAVSFFPSDLVGFFWALCGGVWDGSFGALIKTAVFLLL